MAVEWRRGRAPHNFHLGTLGVICGVKFEPTYVGGGAEIRTLDPL